MKIGYVLGGLALVLAAGFARAANSLQVVIMDYGFELPSILKVKLRITNPTRAALTVTGITGSVRIAGMTGNIATTSQFNLPNGNTDIWVPIVFSPLELINLIQVTKPVKLTIDAVITTPGMQLPVKIEQPIL